MIVIFVLFNIEVYAQQNLIKPLVIENDDNIQKLIDEEIVLTASIDFTGDSINDFICQTKPNNNIGDYYLEYWINSEYKILKKKIKYFTDYDEYWFVNLDNDIEPEIFWATGYSEGIDYVFLDQDFENNEDVPIFYFNPTILDPSKHKEFFWGYYWDITDLKLKKAHNSIKLLCSINHKIYRYGEITVPNSQVQLPVVCFSGKSTQPDTEVEEIKDLRWFSLEELVNEITKK